MFLLALLLEGISLARRFFVVLDMVLLSRHPRATLPPCHAQSNAIN